jgi:hypothetical protein
MTEASDAESTRRIGRRRALRDLGLAAGAGIGIAALSDATALAAATAVTAINVKDYGAQGNGTGNDQPAIQSALNDVPSSGGAVFFPPGDYVVATPLAPKSRTLMYGCHTPVWDGADNPPSACKIRTGGSFSGVGMIASPAGTVGVTIRNLALVGSGVSSSGHGIVLADTSECSWSFEHVTIAGFVGNGIWGRLHVGTLDGCFISRNRGWGVNASGGKFWRDVHASNCFLFYNYYGNLYFGGASSSEAVDFVNCRFERGGTNPDNVFSPIRADSPGVRLGSARFVHFVNCNTDANTGNGFEIVHEATSPDYLPNYIVMTACHLARDGTGSNPESGGTLPSMAGVKVRGSDRGTGLVGGVKLVNCLVTYGRADDDGGGTLRGPKYGVWFENTDFFQWIGGNGSTVTAGNQLYTGTAGPESNWKPLVVDLERNMLTLPVAEPNPALPLVDGLVYLDEAGNRLRVLSGGAWKSVLLT